MITLDDTEEALALADMVGRQFPDLVVLARARNRRHAHLLMDRDVTRIVRETFFSSLRLSEMAMEELGMPAEEIERAVRVFREHDEHQLRASHAIYLDETRRIQSAREAAQELAELLETDRQTETEVAAARPGWRRAAAAILPRHAESDWVLEGGGMRRLRHGPLQFVRTGRHCCTCHPRRRFRPPPPARSRPQSGPTEANSGASPS